MLRGGFGSRSKLDIGERKWGEGEPQLRGERRVYTLVLRGSQPENLFVCSFEFQLEKMRELGQCLGKTTETVQTRFRFYLTIVMF